MSQRSIKRDKLNIFHKKNSFKELNMKVLKDKLYINQLNTNPSSKLSNKSNRLSPNQSNNMSSQSNNTSSQLFNRSSILNLLMPLKLHMHQSHMHKLLMHQLLMHHKEFTHQELFHPTDMELSL